ncbi:ABC transporter ATP-binding protein [Auraticoccus monumenti]|uniref:ABC-2 type transport system ATP-binding protein n=1 Tax=Auraticoccus monumenti TaxID=675864 RepID=A0A1G7BDC6_9ACTN|nr:ABC transporter ATP-binding protein [Auraticoccus monumenti]SDE24376.1 ABC-2 type transport system ATP-binding protein [Auraticoccus monumenti]
MIDVTHLTVRFGHHVAVDDVSFQCRPGQVTGFLGPNGAGKTTTMRVMVGLTAPTSGEVTVDGRRYADLPNPGRHVGVLLDASAQHAGRTAREVLVLAARTMGLPLSRVDQALELVGLAGTEARRRVGNYSLGMRQRLGLAHALIGDPAVLVLDEPANGLDPAGIRWMRDLLRDYAARGGTVLLSSHLLHEVEMVADEIVMIGSGRIVARGDRGQLADLQSGEGSLVDSEDNGRLAAALTDRGLTVTRDATVLKVAAPALEVSRVAQEEHVLLTSLVTQRDTLEDLFLELTADTQRDVAARSTHPEGALR